MGEAADRWLAETDSPPAPETLAFRNRLSDFLRLYGRVPERGAGVDGALRGGEAPPDSGGI